MMKDIDSLAKAAVKDKKFVEQVLEEEKGGFPEITEAEIDDILNEVGKEIEEAPPAEFDYSLFSLYMLENQPICPYCNNILTFFNYELYCEKCSKLNLKLKGDVISIADIAWQMKNMQDSHQ